MTEPGQHELAALFGLNLRRIRAEKKLSQTAFAQLLGIRQSQVSALETGSGEFHSSTLERIAKRLEIPAAELLEAWPENRKPQR